MRLAGRRVRLVALLLQEWTLEFAICFVLSSVSAFFAPVTAYSNKVDDFGVAVGFGLVVALASLSVRFALHIPLLVYVRYRLAVARGFSIRTLMTAIALTYAFSFFIAATLSLGLLWGAATRGLFGMLLPSVIAALLAPLALLYLRGEIFDSAVAKAAQAERETLSGAL